MLVKDIYNNGRIPVSFEIFPPKGELKVDALRSVLDELNGLSPAFISVTCSAGGSGITAKTAELAGIIQNEYNVTSVGHVTCINSDRAGVDKMADDLRSRGVRNVLALRGDRIEGYEPTDFFHASDLISYLKDNTDFCIGAACYPEGHVSCDDFDDDIKYLRIKQDAGADFLISQLFFDNTAFYRFVERMRKDGVTLPVEAGIMPIMGKSQITRMIFMCGASLPAAVIRMLNKYENSPADLMKAGMEYAAYQITDLLRSGLADGIHIYTMNKPEVARFEMDAVKNAGF